ncbi:MAG: DUF4301 family protein [Cyclobacteriaceae bacterium]|nr:DUF4301 family protein [Cyclobacteriaceae bacterium]MCH8517229.1 DUF4301 family protein [Cyclobacteriaceae bacterium]
MSLAIEFENLGYDPDLISDQIEKFRNGFPAAPIVKAATIGDGIFKATDEAKKKYISYYEEKCQEITISKFIPASGAATRMFKHLFAFLHNSEAKIIDHQDVKTFIDHLTQYAFYPHLQKKLEKDDLSIEKCLKAQDYHTLLSYLLTEKGLNYGNLPKGLIPFHTYENSSRTPIQEHFYEGINYAHGKDKTVKLHFTVSPEHEIAFQKHVMQIQEELSSDYEFNFEISFSQQKKKTNTIAVNPDNSVFRQPDGSLLFRPAGHGALLENLNEINADIIFIKNIDNVVPDSLREETIKYKKLIAGCLIEAKSKIDNYLKLLADEESFSENLINEIVLFSKNELNIELADQFQTQNKDQKVKTLFHLLNRPIRICGMVENKGEPGGGPFWVREADGSLSLQIIETAQMDMEDPATLEALKNATHFNPVDLVCAVKDYQDKPFDLLKYRNNNTGFITEKSKDGKDLKAMELPGLWNGAMHHWITIFMEVPLITFNPVKTVNDLSRAEHQA